MARKFFTSRTKTKKFSRHVFGSME
ncbi:DUF1661 domain-containing protein [Porphyromonas gingivalis]|uniref:DUF1661 domain-containing protein n=1 Tax=Porphyromonas gingivalis TaxID=837 RepID=A0AAE9XJG5_PORGN|nr:DUF1661 domain-containing protein [Porphyromonas gingivalis]MDH7903495.1 DUF1661 domain-containing protein [Porphyromonas gingivalis]MDR4975787.1 DUF1661 domain-containing protein [Porphyromonas gingivalis]USI95007.1 DUF1661 domain-containing protein [Porphyromonas gingivalis]USI96915.1 DUF1661 domain-containing protein [Porphyromonas gingivalis]USI98827.1 DUF1661 domain-containing protein [Porphyromonas gingivalis]